MRGVIRGKGRQCPDVVRAWHDPTCLACKLVGYSLVLHRVVGAIHSLTKGLKPSAVFGW